MKKYKRTVLRTVLVFFIVGFLVQYAGVALFTTSSLQKILPLYLRAVSEEIHFDDDSYTEYYTLRTELLKTPVIVFGMNYSCAESYTLLYDLISSLKMNLDIGHLVLTTALDQETVRQAITAESEQMLESVLSDGITNTNGGEAMETFVRNLYALNRSLPPQRQIECTVFDDASAENGNRIAESAYTLYQNTNRAVMVVVDSTWLDYGTAFRKLMENGVLSCTLLQCKYIQQNDSVRGVPDTPTVMLAKREQFGIFDSFFAAANAKAASSEDQLPFSYTYATEYFFVIFHPTLTIDKSEESAGERYD